MDDEMNEGGAPATGGTAWVDEIPEEQWAVYVRAIQLARQRGIQFALGGAFAIASYTGRWRNTKDLDLYVVPEAREAAVEALTDAGLVDYYDQLAYDRDWIYRGIEGDIIVDVIWAMANRRAFVDEQWLTRGPEVELRGERVRIIPAEELIWAKLYIMHKDRCDWPDVLNLIYATGETLNWKHILRRMGDDPLLLSGVLSVYAWLCPGRAALLPTWLWERLPAPQPGSEPEIHERRVRFVDTRPWFMGLAEEAE